MRHKPRAIALTAAVLILPLLTFGAWAENVVGLEARGIDPWVALHSGRTLDVRDELGRPVSARLIEAQLKTAAVEGFVAQAIYASQLPQARRILRLLEMFPHELCTWALAMSDDPLQQFLTLTIIPKPGPRLIYIALALFLIVGHILVRSHCSAVIVLRPSLLRPLVLRC